MAAIRISKWIIVPISLAALGLIALFAVILFRWQQQSQQPTQQPPPVQAAKKRVCPDQWIENAMPGPNAIVEQYFIIAGKRENIAQYDIDWIKANCPVKQPMTAQ